MTSFRSGPLRPCHCRPLSVVGLNFIDNYSQPNAAFLIVSLKPFEERPDATDSAQAMIARLGGKFRQVGGGRAVPLAPPPIIGLGTGGGFSYVLQDTGGSTPQALAGAQPIATVAAGTTKFQDTSLTLDNDGDATNPNSDDLIKTFTYFVVAQYPPCTSCTPPGTAPVNSGPSNYSTITVAIEVAP